MGNPPLSYPLPQLPRRPSPPTKRELSTQDGFKEVPEHEVLGGVVPSLCQHRIVVCKTPAAFSGQGPQRVWEPTSRPRPLWPSPQPCPCPRPRPPGLPCFLAQRTLICRQPSCAGGLQGPQGAAPGSAGEPRSGAHDQDGRGRVGGHGGPCAARQPALCTVSMSEGRRHRDEGLLGAQHRLGAKNPMMLEGPPRSSRRAPRLRGAPPGEHLP